MRIKRCLELDKDKLKFTSLGVLVSSFLIISMIGFNHPGDAEIMFNSSSNVWSVSSQSDWVSDSSDNVVDQRVGALGDSLRLKYPFGGGDGSEMWTLDETLYGTTSSAETNFESNETIGWNDGAVGDSANLDGNHDYLYIPESEVHDFLVAYYCSNFTISLRVNPDVSPSGSPWLFSRGGTDGDKDFFHLTYNPDGEGKVRATVYDDTVTGGYEMDATSPYNLDVDEWNTITVRKSWDGTESKLEVSVNGESNHATDNHPMDGQRESYDDLYVGYNDYSGDHFDGKIDDIHYNNYELSDDFISRYRQHSTGVYSTSYEGIWTSQKWGSSYYEQHITNFTVTTSLEDTGDSYYDEINAKVGVDTNDNGSIDEWSLVSLSDGVNYFDNTDFLLPNGYEYQIKLELLGDGGSPYPSVLDYELTTKTTSNEGPSVSLENPPNDAEIKKKSVTLKVSVSDPDGDKMDLTFYNNSDDNVIGKNSTIDNGTYEQEWSNLAYNQTYEWRVEISDNRETVTEVWSFTVRNPDYFSYKYFFKKLLSYLFPITMLLLFGFLIIKGIGSIGSGL